MPRFRYAGGDQRPDVYGVIEPGDVVEFAQKPDWGIWESTSKPAERAPTPQPNYLDDEQPSADVPADTAKEG